MLSPGTRKRDITIKKDIYEKFGVKEYWLIDPKGESIDVYLLQEGKYELVSTYHNFSQEEWDDMREEDKAEIQLSLKLSLYDDLEIIVKEVFED